MFSTGLSQTPLLNASLFVKWFITVISEDTDILVIHTVFKNNVKIIKVKLQGEGFIKETCEF